MLDDRYRCALALPAARCFTMFDLAEHPSVLAAVRSLLLPDAGELSARLHALNVYSQGGFFKVCKGGWLAFPGTPCCLREAFPLVQHALKAHCHAEPCNPPRTLAALPGPRRRIGTPHAATWWARWWSACR